MAKKTRPSIRLIFCCTAAAFWLAGLGLLSFQPPPSALAAGMQATDYYPPPPGDYTPVDDYPEPGFPTITPGSYPGPGLPTTPPLATRTPLPPGVPSPTAGSVTASASPTGILSPSPSVTPGRDLYATENAEMGGAQVTPPPEESFTPTAGPAEPISPAPDSPDGFQFNQKLFLIGLLVPLGVVILGGILYKTLNSSEFQ